MIKYISFVFSVLLFVNLVTAKYVINKAKVEANSTQTLEVYEINLQDQTWVINERTKQIPILILEIRYETQDRLDIRIGEKSQFQIPKDIEPFQSVFNDIEEPENLADGEEYKYEVEIQSEIINIIRKDSKETIFTIENIAFARLYQEFKTTIPTPYFFGLGERNQKGFRFQEGIYTLNAKDVPKLMEDGKTPGKNVYSSQPIYLMKEKSGHFHIFFFKTASPMDVIYESNSLTFKTISGIMHFKYFFGNHNPDSAVKLYHDYLGKFALHPFWASGYHQSRWLYRDGNRLIEVIKNYKQNNLPLDVIWSDLDYMNDRQIFSVDSSKFTQDHYNEIQNTLHVNYVPLIDVAVGVKYDKQDKGYREGVNMDIFLRSPKTGYRFQGYVWAGDSYFPDFFHPNISLYWSSMLESLHKQCNYSGIWIDMNEPTNFCDGECEWSRSRPVDDNQNESFKHDIIKLPYTPGQTRLDKMTLSINIKHYNGMVHKDVHNLYGFQHCYNTYLGQKKLGKPLPFSLSRSTFPGLGKYCSHWTGDNAATWDFLYLSVGQIFQFNIFGVPMTGADVCGFMDPTNDKLCARWVQVAALYPFMRNHNNDQSPDQEFYALGDVVLRAAQKNLKLRYSLLKWYYSLFIRSGYSGTIFRPLFFLFSGDQKVFQDDVLDTQILLGNELMATPILKSGQVIRKAYFPSDNWYDFLTGLLLHKANEEGRDHLVYCKLDDYIPLFIRGGSIIFQQKTKDVLTTHDLGSHFNIVIALGDAKQPAEGNFIDLEDYNDDQHIYDNCVEDNCVLNASFQLVEDVYKFTLQRAKPIKKSNEQQEEQISPKHSIHIDQMRVYGLPHKILEQMNEVTCATNNKSIGVECQIKALKFPYNSMIIFNQSFGVELGGDGGAFEIQIKLSAQ